LNKNKNKPPYFIRFILVPMVKLLPTFLETYMFETPKMKVQNNDQSE